MTGPAPPILNLRIPLDSVKQATCKAVCGIRRCPRRPLVRRRADRDRRRHCRGGRRPARRLFGHHRRLGRTVRLCAGGGERLRLRAGADRPRACADRLAVPLLPVRLAAAFDLLAMAAMVSLATSSPCRAGGSAAVLVARGAQPDAAQHAAVRAAGTVGRGSRLFALVSILLMLRALVPLVRGDRGHPRS